MINRKTILAAEILLTALPLGFHVHRKTGSLLTATLTFCITLFVIDSFLISPVKAWDNLSMFFNPFILSTGAFTTSLIYLNYTGIALAAAKWQALGISFITMVFGFMFLRMWP